MVEEQIYKRGITDSKILNAFRSVNRHLFVKPEFIDQAYGDKILPIGEGVSESTISSPYYLAIMTLVIAPNSQKKVLEIGTGSGYLSAILAELSKEVYTIEIFEDLSRAAQQRIKQLGYKNIKFKIGDGYEGWMEHQPYDSIIVTCSPDHIPQPLIQQLAVGGRMVIPVSYSTNSQELILIEKEMDGNLKKTNLISAKFVPLIRGKSDK